MITRILAAAVALALVVPLLVWGGQIGAEALVLLVAIIGMDEFVKMVVPQVTVPSRMGLATLGGGLYAGIVWGSEIGLQDGASLGLVALATLVALVFGLLRVPSTEEGARAGMALTAGLIWAPVMLSFLPRIRAFEGGLIWITLLLVITFAGDTGAYFAGRAFGKTKLLERVSPKKTREGALGGAVLAVVGACVVKYLALPDVDWWHAVALGLVLDAFGVVGDLAESMLKRAYGVKDSGRIMPGHGGILDRVDSLLFTGPVLWCYATFFGLAGAS